MADLQTIRSNVNTMIGRTVPAATVDMYINSACEWLGKNIPHIYEEEMWKHTFVSGDASGFIDNFQLPANINFIRTAALVDVTTAGSEAFYELIPVSPDDLWDTDKLDGYRSGSISFYTGSLDISGSKTFTRNTFSGSGPLIGRTNRAGQPEFIYRIARNVYIHPYINTDYVGWELRLLLQMYPDALASNTDTNTVTDNHPYALSHLTAGLLWGSRLHDIKRAETEFGFAIRFLGDIASDDMLKKLLNIDSKFIR